MRLSILAPLFALGLAPLSAMAADTPPPPKTWQVEGTLDDIAFAIENAIINAGLIVDGENHVGEMLNRTKSDVGGGADIFTDANIYTFCSASVSRQVMEMDPLNIQFCPYSIFYFETPDAPGTITVGHRDYADLPPVQELLDGIVSEALMLD